MCNANKWCVMLEWEIEVLNGKKGVWVFSHKHVLNLWMVLPVFFKKGNYSNFLPIYCHS